jgi:eukaryotic-like serine/threonine-protein kinase
MSAAGLVATRPQNWQAIKALFEATLREEPDQRLAFLRKRCADPSLCAEVERLLAEHDQTKTVRFPPTAGEFPLSAITEDNQRIAQGELLADRFRIVRFIASGGMGQVYEAEDEELREPVALKTIRPDLLAQPNAVARFKREVHLARQVTHPNVCRIFDLFRDTRGGELSHEVIFVSMELLKGQPLSARLRDGGAMREAEALPLIRQMASALSAAHAAGIVHRDFKPGNVVLVGMPGQENLRAVVTDFGLAVQSLIPDESFSVSTSQHIVGTPAYMSPEQLEGRPATASSDIYALGLVIYEMLTGAQPFQGDTPLSAALKRLSENPTPPRKFKPGLSPAWEKVILRCLERDPAKRPASAEEMLHALSSEDCTTAVGPRRIRARVAVPALAFLLLVGAAAGYIAHRGKARMQPAAPTTSAGSVHPRRSVAVLGFKNLSGRPGAFDVSTALSEMTTSELAAGGQLRAIPQETVSQMKISLALPEADGYSADTLRKIRRNIGCDDIIVGDYLATGDRKIRVDLKLEDAVSGEFIDSVIEQGEEDQIADLVSRAGVSLRAKLGAGQVTATQAAQVKATLPSNPDAARFYTQGLERLRSFDSISARDFLQQAVNVEPNFPLSHVALAKAWASLGYDVKAMEESKKAYELSSALGPDDRRDVESQYLQTTHEWDKALEVRKSIFQSYPDNLEYGLALAGLEVAAAKSQDALNTLDTLRKLPAPLGQDPRIDLMESSATLYGGNFERSRAAALRTLEIARAQGSTILAASALLNECMALERLGKGKEAIAACTGAQETYQQVGNPERVATATGAIGNVLLDQGDFAAAKTRYQEALAIFERIGNQAGVSHCAANIGVTLGTTGDIRGSIKMFEQVVASQREVGNKRGVCLNLSNLGESFLLIGDLANAEAKEEEALALSHDVDDKDTQTLTLRLLSEVLYDRGNLDASRDRLDQAQLLLQQTGHTKFERYVLASQAKLLLVGGDTKAARSKFEEAVSVSTRMGDKSDAASDQLALADLSIEEGRPADAEASTRSAIAEFHAERDLDDESSAHEILSRALLSMGRAAEAQKEVQLAKSSVSSTQRPDARWEWSLAAARVQCALGNFSSASSMLQTVLAEATKSGFVPYQFEARLALGEAELKSGQSSEGATDLAALEKDATPKGFLLIAREAAAARAKQPEH